MSGELGRREPTDFEHVAKYPLSALAPVVPPPGTERSLGLPSYWRVWDQGQEGACVGFGTSAMMGITNSRQVLRETGSKVTLRFAPHWLYEEAQIVDEWADTPPAEGTSVRAACDVLRVQGHRRVRYGVAQPVDPKWGIVTNRWAQNVDEIRASIYGELAVSFGINWYHAFDTPYEKDGELWVDLPAGNAIRGGHDVCLYRMSDRRQAFRLMNSWGASYPPVWMPYSVVQRLLDESGEAAVITDR